MLVPFGLFGKTAFLAERVLGNVVASGVKVLVLAVIVGIGTNLFGEFTQGWGGDQPSLEDTLALAPLHGVGIARRIEQVTRGTFLIKPGSLFPALHRMEHAGWVASDWGETDSGRRAKFYRLSAAGRRQLEKETARWGKASLAINRALGAEG